jgi:hypothetical protein
MILPIKLFRVLLGPELITHLFINRQMMQFRQLEEGLDIWFCVEQNEIVEVAETTNAKREDSVEDLFRVCKFRNQKDLVNELNGVFQDPLPPS